jgi:hypothetical protein
MKTKIIPWVITWDGIVTKIHKHYLKELAIGNQIEAYMQSLTIKKTLESISLDYRRGGEITIEQVKENEDVRPSVDEKVNQDEPGDTAAKK